jgi:hypothetical protein
MSWTIKRTLSDLLDDTIEAVDPACRTVAEDGAKMMVRVVKQNTPVDNGFLRDSIQTSPTKVTVSQLGEKAYESGAFTEVDYAPHVEHGTGLWGPKHAKYRIEPKDPNGVLAFYVRGPSVASGKGYDVAEGNLVFAKYVMHPGSPGQHMFATGAALVEASFDEVAARGLNQWARDSERGI